MKVLLFEYICGGGFNRQPLPTSLAQEGDLMLQALLDNFAQLPDIELTVMLDGRLQGKLDTTAVRRVEIITPGHDVEAEFARLLATCDAAWPIAPESDGVLETLCLAVAAQAKQLLTSPAAAVALAGDKYQTYRRLSQHHIPTVPTQWADQAHFTDGEWIIKPIDGAGCADSWVLDCPKDQPDPAMLTPRFIVQPHLQGDKTSLSCLCQQGDSWLLSVNLQRFQRVGQHYQLTDIIVNHQPGSEKHRQLAAQVAKAFPELWGYVGIDLIETASESLVLEINPRLTTSFAALHAALGLNVAALAVQLLHGQPTVITTANQAITLNVS